ncbi:MAG: histidine kinase dimerization/phosphoacceptor domain -containing protein [Gelidibacter sp.]
MKQQLTIVLVLLCTAVSLAQNSDSAKLDSLLNWLDEHITIPQDSTEIAASSYKAIRLSKKVDNQEALAEVYRYLVTYHKDYSKLDSAFYYVEKAKDIYLEQKKDDQLGFTYLKWEELLMVKADYAEANKYVYKALDIFEKTKNQRGIAICYAAIGELKYYERSYAQGVEWCNKAIAILEPLDFPEDLANTYRLKAFDMLFADVDHREALATINKSIDLYKSIGEAGIPMMAAINWRGNIYKYMDRFDEAIADYQANFDNSTKMGLERYLIPSLANIGHVYLIQGKYKEALPYNLRAIDIMKKTGNVRNLWENYMHVSNIYESLGDYKLALYYHHLYAEAHEEFKDNTIHSLESEAEQKYLTGQKNATIYFQDEKIAQQKKTKTLYIALTSLLATILFGLIYNYRKRQKRNRELTVLNSQLDTKNKQNELLLKEIHHRVKNNLELVKSLLALQSAQLEDSASKEAMMASQNRVQSMGIIHQKLYQGENLGSIDMKDYFINLGEGVLDTFNAEEKVKIECAMDNLELDVDTAVPIGLIVNELLTNALKYAFPENGKGNILISLSQSTPETLTLKVADNGIGKVVGLAPKGTGFGTQLIKLLTQQLDGKMFEEHDNGTSILFQFKTKPAA